jgi:hypothetical protein
MALAPYRLGGRLSHCATGAAIRIDIRAVTLVSRLAIADYFAAHSDRQLRDKGTLANSKAQ